MESRAASWAADQPLVRVAAPLREQVLAAVRKAILSFQLRPGQRLIERELVEQLGVSRTTIREVLSQLSAEGLVTVIPQRGTVVAVLSADEAADIYEMRAMLESLAVRCFVSRARPGDVTRLRAAVRKMEQAADVSGDIDAQLAAKDEFYAALLAGVRSPPLVETLERLQARVRVLRATSLSATGRPKEAVREIRQVVEAVEAGDADRAAEACLAHVRNAARTGLARLAELNAEGKLTP